MAELGPASYGGEVTPERVRPDEGGPFESLRELCHDLRHPVATIAALLAAAQVESELSPALEARFEQIWAELRSITALYGQVLGESPSSIVRMDVLVTEAVEGALLTSDAAVVSDCERTVVRGNAAALRRAVWNLIENAIRAAGDGGRVLVRAHAGEDDTVVISVADSGKGFGVGEAGVAGLGLKIASRVARDHDGRLRVGQAHELGGAMVSLVLPAAVDETLTPELGAALTREAESTM